ncbi:hypothetical protein B9G55_22810 [Saccharibacillus sp. O16]|nr:hypothetical protein B9G55_22810 [Saccharibacillus sp. O16]
MNTKSKTVSKLLFILFGLNTINGLIMIVNNFDGKQGAVLLGFVLVLISIVMLILIGRDLYKMKGKDEAGCKN